MGLGKTLQVLGWLGLNPKARPAVVVCPAVAKYVWQDQIHQHTHMGCQILHGRSPFPTIGSRILIVNYEIVHYWEEALLALRPKVLILDESHFVKTRGIKRTKTCKRLASVAKHVIGMSGTPIINRPVEFFPILNMVRPTEFKSFWKFAFRYCDPKRAWQGHGWNFNGAGHMEELHERTKPFLIRRRKKNVLKELPDKRRSIIPVDIKRKEYDRARDDFLNWVEDVRGAKAREQAAKAQALVKIGQLKRLAALGKLAAAEQWIQDFLETTNEKLVVFCHHREVFQELYNRFKKIAARGGGSMDRAQQIERFQKKKACHLFLGTTKADGTAITLTKSSTVLFLELGWTHGEHEQAEDRVHRIGQTEAVQIYYMLARDTIDLYVWEIIEKKKKVVEKILDGKAVLDSGLSFKQIIQMVRR